MDTWKISEFVDLHLQPHVNSLPSNLKDTTDYLRKIQKSGPPETLLVSLDVTSLYTNIPHEDGIRACKEAWEERPVKDPPTETLVKLLTLILKCNNFEFKGKHYLQVQGTAMGTKMAPAYANIFMGRLEGQLLRSTSLKPFSWFRFIDNVDMKWTHGPENLKIFLQEANSFHPTIRFMAEVSTEEHVFLDTKSRLVGNNIDVDLYTKPTDTHQYLLPSTATRSTAAEMFHIVWLSVSGEYDQILIHLSLGQQSYRTNFEDEVTTYNQYPQRPRKPGHKEETTCFATSPNQNNQAH